MAAQRLHAHAWVMCTALRIRSAACTARRTGLANAVILPYVMEAFGPAVYYKLARLAEAVGINGKDDEEKAKAFLREIRRMKRGYAYPGFPSILFRIRISRR